MILSERMLELQHAVKAYGETSIRNYQLLHKLGDEIIGTLSAYLGAGAQIIGVAPEGEWTHRQGDYRDAKFSTHHRGVLSIEPILMGVGLRIPHTNNEGGFWLRMVVKMEISGEAISVEIIDGKTVRGISSDYSVRDLAKIQEAIFECARDTLCNPVRSARGIGRIGFIDEV